MDKILSKAVSVIAVAWSLFHLYTGAFGSLEAYQQRLVHLIFAVVLIFLLHPAWGRRDKPKPGATDWMWLVLALAALSYPLVDYNAIMSERFAYVTPFTPGQRVLGVVAVVVVLEATRRVTGPILPAIAAFFLIYAFIGRYLPGILHHTGYNLDVVLDNQYLTTEGMLGTPLGASATLVVLFIIFGAFLQRSGLGELFMAVAMGVAGRFSGGPALVAVVSSGLMGSISGSAVANVVTTGTMTIPMMKRIGYKPHYAGAVEAVASTGGQIMPPVMGTVAFLMVQYTAIPYIKIILYALIPAIVYYLAVGLMVHWEAVKTGMRGLTPEEMPDWKGTVREKWHLALPIVVLLWLLGRGFTPQYAVVYSLLALVLVANLRPNTRMGPKAIWQALEAGAQGTLIVATATATAGMITGIFGLTGLGLRFTDAIFDVAGANLMIALLMVFATTMVLGMGMPPSGSYIVQVAVTIPALITMLGDIQGFSPLVAMVVAHFFVMYYACLAQITPPVALASIAAAGIAQSDVWKTAVMAVGLGFAGYVVPFVFVYQPGLLLLDTPANILIAVGSVVAAVLALSIAFEGYFLRSLGWLERGLALAGGLLLIERHITTDGVGLALLLALTIWQVVKSRRVAASQWALADWAPDGEKKG